MIAGILKSKVFKNSGIYTLTGVLNGAIPFFMLPILTSYLTTAEYGTLSMFLVLVAFVSPFTGLNVHGAVSRQFYDQEDIDFPKYIFNCLVILFSSSIIVAVIMFSFSGIISEYSGFPKSWLLAVVYYSFFQFLNLVMLVLWQGQEKPLPYGVFMVSRTILEILLSLLLVISLSQGWEGRVTAQLIVISVFGSVSLFFLFKKKLLNFGISKDYIKHALKFSLPLIPHTLGMVLFTMSDRLFITNMIDISATGIYFVAYQIGQIIYLFTDSFNKAWVPWFYRGLKSAEEGPKQNIIKITYIYFVLILIGAGIFTLITPFVFDLIIDEKFHAAQDYVIWFAFGFAFNGMYKMVCNYFFYTLNTKVVATVTILAGILNVVLNYFFIIRLGAIGAAIASTISFFFSFLFTWILAIREYPMPWNLRFVFDKKK